jgi:hypothetical protein
MDPLASPIVAGTGATSPLDAFLPHWHWRSRNTAILPTSALAAFAAAREVTLAELPTAAALRNVDPGVTVLDDLLGQGFVPLCEPDDAGVVLGRIGQRWQKGHLSSGVGAFADFGAPGHAKAALLVAAEGCGPDSLVVIEARVEATDERTVQEFARHWVVSAWSNRLVYRELLDAIRLRLGVRRFSARPAVSDT